MLANFIVQLVIASATGFLPKHTRNLTGPYKFPPAHIWFSIKKNIIFCAIPVAFKYAMNICHLILKL